MTRLEENETTVLIDPVSPQQDRVAGAMKPQSHRMAFNVFTNWAGQFVAIISGFIIPRLVSDQLGQARLGIWDFAWSMYGYVLFSELSFGSSVAQYVARYRARNEWGELNRALNTCQAMILLNMIVGLLVTAVLYYLTPALLTRNHPEFAHLVPLGRSVVLWMGIAAVAMMPIRIYNGIITGSQRFDLLNLVNGSSDLFQIIGFITVLRMGYSLTALAAVVIGCTLYTGLAKYYLSRRLCPQLHIRPRWEGRDLVVDIAAYGGKTLVMAVSQILLYQTNTMLVTYYLSPIAVALYSRPRTLVVQVMKIMESYAKVFIPVASDIRSRGSSEELTRLLANGINYALYIVLPIMAVLTFMGGPILRLWMGDDYNQSTVLTVFALGHLAILMNGPTYQILMGLSCHGRAAVASLFTAAASVILNILLIGYLDLGLVGAALSIAIPQTLYGGLILPMIACRAMRIRMRDYLGCLSIGPVLAVLPLVAFLLVTRELFSGSLNTLLGVGLGAGGLLQVAVYWRFVIPAEVKQRIRDRVRVLK